MEAIWNSNPDVNVLYCFDDGNCFVKQSEASSYKKDTQKNYKIVNRPMPEISQAEPKEEKPTPKNKK